ncbi:MAG: AbgT family transporter [Marinisporobacter sp.]|jgi:aminobenzoyl-glutamate transport protein|nr:AbgT family transporter [Marinisporobacter sp.]
MANSNKKKGLFYRFLDFVERTGNKLPHPFNLFVILTLTVVLVSVVLSAMEIQAKHPSKDEIIMAKSLLSKEGLRYMVLNVTKNFVNFKPLGLVLTIMLGIGMVEQTGLMSAFMRKFIMGMPEKLIIAAIFLIGICGNVASGSSIIIVPPIAGAIFYGIKKNPLVGVAAGYAATCAGFTANLIIVGTDALLAGITEEAAKIVDPSLAISPAINYYFMIASTIVLTIVGVWVTSFIEKRAGKYSPKSEVCIEDDVTTEITKEEEKGLKSAGIATVIYWALVGISLIPESSPFRSDTGGLIPSPFLKGIVTFLFLWFLTMGIAYGVTSGKIKKGADIPTMMGNIISSLGGYIVLTFIIAQFVSYFNWTNVGLILAVSAGKLLNAINFTGMPMIICIILFSAFVNLFIGSGSSKWALLAPVFVPMFMMLGYSPAFAQVSYRIGDSMTNCITPLFPYFPIMLGFLKKYDPDAGVGTVMSMTVPYSLVFGIVWIIQLIIWYALKLPLGPGATIF